MGYEHVPQLMQPCLYALIFVLSTSTKVLSGHPASRPALVDFAHLITKNLSLLVCGHIVPEKGRQLVGQRERGQQWLKQRKVSGYYTVVESESLSGGARVAMTVSGLG